MKVECDPEADAVYIRLRDSEVATTRELDDNLIIDLDKDGKIVGIELLFVSDYLRPEDLETLTLTTLRSA